MNPLAFWPLLLLSLASLIMPPLAKQPLNNLEKLAKSDYQLYHNSRFDFSISYPKNLLLPQGEADNHDGQRFLSRDKEIEMLVYGGFNIDDQSLDQLYSAEIKEATDNGGKVTYQVKKSRWFVVSGYRGERIFYHKRILEGDIIKTFQIEYPVAQKAVFDEVTAHMAASFH